MTSAVAQQESVGELPRPGLIGLAIRAALAVVVLMGLYDAVRYPASYWDGFGNPVGALPLFLPLILFSGWVVNKLLLKNWGFWPNVALVAGAGVAMIIGATQGNAWGPPIGYYVWVWQLLFTGLLGPAFFLAVLLRTPGCEMRSYAHLRATLKGNDATPSVCPGWIDRADGIRLFGKW